MNPYFLAMRLITQKNIKFFIGIKLLSYSIFEDNVMCDVIKIRLKGKDERRSVKENP